MTAHQVIRAESLQPTMKPLPWGLQFAAIVAVAFYLHGICWWTVPPDMKLYLFPWYEHIVARGPVAAFAEPFSNYTPPYLYLMAAGSLANGFLSPMTVIKLLSVAGTAFLAFAVADLLKAMGADPKRAAFVFLLPTVILNAALFAQCDALWAGACILAVASMIRGRSIAALIWCGVAIAFKAQAVFLAPFIIGALIGRWVPLWQWGIPPIVSVLLMLPAWLAGWPASDLALIYVRQVEYFTFPGNLANPWVWGTEFAPTAAQHIYIVGYVAAAAGATAISFFTASSVHRPKAMLLLALLSAMAIPWLLPKMHERYLFLADVLAFSLALAQRNRPCIAIGILVQLTSLSALVAYIYNWPAPVLAGSLVGGAALIAICCATNASRDAEAKFTLRVLRRLLRQTDEEPLHLRPLLGSRQAR